MAHITLRSLQHYRVLAGLSQRQLAKAAGVSYQTIRRLEAGGDAGEVTLMVLTHIAAALEVSLSALLDTAEPGVSTPRAPQRLNLHEARLLRRIATKANAAATMTKTERELVLPALLRKGLISLVAGQIRLHPDVAESLMP